MFPRFRLRRTRDRQSGQLPAASDTPQNGRLGVRQDESFPQVLPRRISLEALRGTAEEDHHSAGMRPSVAREDEIQEAKVAIRRVGSHVTTSHSRMVVAKAHGRNVGSETRSGRKFSPQHYTKYVNSVFKLNDETFQFQTSNMT